MEEARKMLALNQAEFIKADRDATLVAGEGNIVGNKILIVDLDKLGNYLSDNKWKCIGAGGLLASCGFFYMLHGRMTADKALTFFPQTVQHFTQRKDKVSQIERVLSRQRDRVKKIAITGLTGSGKSELAKGYAQYYYYSWYHINKAYYIKTPLIRWLDGKNPLIAYEQFALTLHINTRRFLAGQTDQDPPNTLLYQNRVIQAVNDKLKHHPGWLLIWDDVTDYASVEPFLPKAEGLTGTLLFTTQDTQFLNAERLVNISDGMDDSDAVNLLQNVSGVQNPVEAKELVHKLQRLPLAIMSAGIYIKYKRQQGEVPLSFKSYPLFSAELERSWMREQYPDFYDDPKKSTQLSAVKLVIETVISNDVRELLTFCSLVDIRCIPDFLLKEYYRSEEQSEELLRSACRYGLLNPIKRENKAWYIHEVTQQYLQQQFKKQLSEKNSTALKILERTLNVFNAQDRENENTKKQQQLLPHVMSFTLLLSDISVRSCERSFFEKLKAFIRTWHIIITRLAVLEGFSPTTVEFVCKSYECREKFYERNNFPKEEVLLGLIETGLAFWSINKVDYAKDRWKRSLVLLSSLYNYQSIPILSVIKKLISNLEGNINTMFLREFADLLKEIGKFLSNRIERLLFYKAAIDIYLEIDCRNLAFDCFEKQLLPSIIYYEEEAISCFERKEYENASNFYRMMLRIELTLGLFKPQSISYTLYNFSNVLIKQDEYGEALTTLFRTISFIDKALDQTDIKESETISRLLRRKAGCLFNIGKIYTDGETKNLDEALKYFKESLSLFKTLPPDNNILQNIDQISKTIEEIERGLNNRPAPQGSV